MIAEANNGSLELFEDKITIKRKGALAFMSQGLKGEKDIRLTQVTAVQFKKAGMMTNGYLQLTVQGGKESLGGLIAATNDENTVMFRRKNQDDFKRIREAIESKLSAMDAGSNAQPNPTSNLNELEKLASLQDKSIVSEEEFNSKKTQLLGL